MPIQRICVFSGSSSGNAAEYQVAAERLGEEIANRGIGLVYGGASIGLMGTLADKVLACGGEVIGVIPKKLVDKEVAHHGLTELRIVTTMHERKAIMSDLSDAVIALPGGFGTLDELFETLTWSQLGYKQAPCGLLNTAGYYDRLLDFLDHSVSQRFVSPTHRTMVLSDTDASSLLDQLNAYTPPDVEKWLDRFVDR